MKELFSRISKINIGADDQFLSGLPDRDIWVLRDDELGGFWGTKFRKYSSIIDYCNRKGIKEIIATGGINSNNLAAAVVLCAEAGLRLTVFAVLDHETSTNMNTGNRMIVRLGTPVERLHLVPRVDKGRVPDLMVECANMFKSQGLQTLILEEGGGCLAAVPGCLTLAADIFRPRDEWSDAKGPDHIFIDSGTALTSASLAAGMISSNHSKKCKLHIIQMAGFDEQVKQAFDQWVSPVTGVSFQAVEHFVRVYRPLSPRSYGAVSSKLFEFMRYMVQTHGILVDPVYTAKLFMRAFDLIAGQNLKGRILIVHTGGITGLMGYHL